MSSKKSVSVIFIRHAQSTENVKIQNCVDGLKKIQSYQLPTLREISSAVSLLRYELDAPISELGKTQLDDTSSYIKGCQFLTRFRVQIIAYSPLIRAKDTCLTIFPNSKAIELECLREATPFEQFHSASVMERVRRFEEWLYECEYERILVVGHSQFFKKLLKMTNLMRNCDIWRSDCTITVNRTLSSTSASNARTYTWTNPELLFRTQLALPSTFEKLPSIDATNKENLERVVVEKKSNDQLQLQDTDEPTCRICQMTGSETSGQRMIRPCLCTGSQAFVHIDCLNSWRSTSVTAELLLSDTGARIVTALMIFFAIIVLGAVLFFCTSLLKLDTVGYILNQLRINRWWRSMSIDSGTRTHLIRSSGSCPMLTIPYPNILVQIGQILGYFQNTRAMYVSIPCDGYFAVYVDMIILGFCAIAVIGIVLYIRMETDLIPAFILFIRQAHYSLRTGTPMIWPETILNTAVLILSLLSLISNARIAILIGCGIAMKSLYSFVSVYGRNLAQTLGEQILEPICHSNQE
eukprot:gene7985-16340_t